MGLLETTAPATLQAVIIFLTVIDCAAIGLRLYTKKALGQRLTIDDWSAVLGFSFVLALAVYFSIGIANHYVGYPYPEDFTGDEYHPIASGSYQHFWVWHLLLFIALWFIKCSLVLLYRRILVADTGNYTDWANILVLLSLILVTLWSLSFALTWSLACRPLRDFWDFPYVPSKPTCVDTWKLNSAITISDFLIDLIILLVPVPMVWRLHLPTMRKIAVLIVFGLGSIAVAASIMRMVRVVWVASDETNDIDGLLLNTTVLFWSMIEANLGLLAACLPTLRGIVKIRSVDTLIQSYRSRSWLKSSGRYNQSTGEHDGLPLTRSTFTEGNDSPNKRQMKHPHDITITTTHSMEVN